MLRSQASAAPVPSLDSVKGRPVAMSLPLPAARERRNLQRREALVHRIVAEFDDMPGLVLSMKQASRFLGVDADACGRILASLTDSGVLRLGARDCYSRREPGV